MFPILTTRFNTTTWNENALYRQKFSCCVYGSPREISPKIRRDVNVYMIEMNNEKKINQILGIGLIKNRPFDRYMTSLYNEKNYTRYVYRGELHIDRDFMITHKPKLVEVLEVILFKGKTHLKRGYAFSALTDKFLKDERCIGLDIRAEIADLFSLFAMLNSRRDANENNYPTQLVPVPILVAPPIPPATFTGPGIGI